VGGRFFDGHQKRCLPLFFPQFITIQNLFQRGFTMGVHYSLDRIYGDPAALAREFVQDTLDRTEIEDHIARATSLGNREPSSGSSGGTYPEGNEKGPVRLVK
jgi:hypothetical protein